MKILFALLALLAATVASAQTREVQEKRLAEYLPYAGQPVEKFQFWDLIRYELVGEYKVIVWPRLNEAYLITVDAPCNDLEWAHSIGLTSSVHQVQLDVVYLGSRNPAAATHPSSCLPASASASLASVTRW